LCCPVELFKGDLIRIKILHDVLLGETRANRSR
jgi:hypothetical protein